MTKNLKRAAVAGLMGAVLSAACGDSGPTAPSPLPGGTPTTPPTVPRTPADTAPDVQGFWEGETRNRHWPEGRNWRTDTASVDGPSQFCEVVTQDGYSIEFAVANARGTIDRHGVFTFVERGSSGYDDGCGAISNSGEIRFEGDEMNYDVLKETGTCGTFRYEGRLEWVPEVTMTHLADDHPCYTHTGT